MNPCFWRIPRVPQFSRHQGAYAQKEGISQRGETLRALSSQIEIERTRIWKRGVGGSPQGFTTLQILHNQNPQADFPLPFIEHLLEHVVGKESYSFLHSFFEYNQIIVDPHKTAFSTIWGVYVSRKMCFGLINAPSTWQRLMSTLFREFLRDSLEVFLDNLCVHSTWRRQIWCLRKVLERCRPYCFSLNPLKCQF